MPGPERCFRALLAALRLALGALFVVTGYMKLLAPYENFRAAIAGYGIVTGPVAELMARTLPWGEFILGAFLLVGLWQRLSLAALWAMNSSFILALGWSMLRGDAAKDCGCFGDAVHLNTHQTFWLDIGLWIAFLFVFTFSELSAAFSLDRHYAKR